MVELRVLTLTNVPIIVAETSEDPKVTDSVQFYNYWMRFIPIGGALYTLYIYDDELLLGPFLVAVLEL